MDALTFKNLEADHLRGLANEAIGEAQRRMHEVPAKDLPQFAATLLSIADRKSTKNSKTTPP